MADLATAKRTFVLDGVHGGSAGIHPAAPAYRLVLRARPEAIEAVSQALELALPTRPKTSATSGLRSARGSARIVAEVIDRGRSRPDGSTSGTTDCFRHGSPTATSPSSSPAPAPKRRSMPAAHRTCRLPPSRSVPAPARSSARRKWCCCAWRMTPSAWSAGAPLPTMCSVCWTGSRTLEALALPADTMGGYLSHRERLSGWF